MTTVVRCRIAALRCRLLALAVLVCGAGARPAQVRAATSPPAGGGTLRVASKAFTESVILGEIVTQWARSHGVEARHRSALGGTRLLWNALLAGEIDLYPEYTGTILTELLGSAFRDAQPEGGAIRDVAVRDSLGARGIGMIGPLGFNNSYAIGVTSARARLLGLSRISDLRAHPALRFGFSSEFMNRQDGWPALRARYQLPQADVRGLDHDLAYRAIASGAIDATDLYATDAEIRHYDLRILEDDLQLFPRYEAVLLYRLDTTPRAGIDAVRLLRDRIDGTTMAALNARAKLDRVPETQVAALFLRTALGQVRNGNGDDGGNDGKGDNNVGDVDKPGKFGLPVPAGVSEPGVARRTLAHSREHLLLVAVSLLAAILCAVPLGILAARRPRLGQLLLGIAGLVQTVPSLALLVFMIPLFGIGALPAMVALFLYSLLPIVRNTHAGLRNIPAPLRESADALGLSRGAILRLVELPLASPLVLAGIKSAAVINVGTATLGALIGAGGFGQPIFTGIRLDDMGLILEGAVPASLLALLVQGLFELVERLVVPRGLRLPPSA